MCPGFKAYQRDMKRRVCSHISINAARIDENSTPKYPKYRGKKKSAPPGFEAGSPACKTTMILPRETHKIVLEFGPNTNFHLFQFLGIKLKASLSKIYYPTSCHRHAALEYLRAQFVKLVVEILNALSGL